MKIAIITGASSGIGSEFARQIDSLKQVDQLWLIARREELMHKLADTLSTPCHILPIDLSNRSESSLLSQELEKHTPEVQFCINNAGFGMNGDFCELDREQQMHMVDVNCTSIVDIAYRVLPYMQTGSHLITTSSIAGFGPLGAFAMYGATKAFATSLTVSLAVELKDRGVFVTAVTPGSVATDFQQKSRGGTNRKKKLFSKRTPASTIVTQALQDAQAGKLFSVYGFSSKCIKLLAPLLPQFWAARFAYTTIYPKSDDA